ncbi:MAG: DUF6263 family protein [Ginsengibacter sp.]
MKKLQLIFAAAICFSTTSIGQSNGSLKLSKGQKYQVENTLQTNSSTDVQGQTMESKINVTSTYNIEVKDKANNNYNLSNTITHLLMDMTMMGNEINFDSNKPEDMNGEMGTALKDYINKPKDVVIDQTGKIISKDETDTSAEGIAKQLNLAATGYGAQMAFLALPENAKVGSNWTDSSNEGGVSRTTNYTIKDISGNIATVSFNGTVTSKTTMERQGMEVTSNTTGKFSGEEKVDTKTGVVQSNTTTGDATGTVSAMGQDFPMTSKVTSTTTVKAL